jgi:delta 1-pyrroline-5-carboxylate dehydrogenase
VTINNYKVPENTTSSLSLAQHVPTRDGRNIANGMKEAIIGFKTIAEVKSAAKNLARSATQSELWSRGEERAAILRRIGK